MDILNKLKKLLNPYDYDSHKLDEKEFVGREEYIENLDLVLEDYKDSLKLKNIVISGEKSIGKSTLLNRFEQVLNNHNFATYYKEIPRSCSNKYDEFDFFKELISDLFNRFAPIENSCFDTKQQEIWYSLTENCLEHNSNFMDRKLDFASVYSNRIKGRDVKLSDKSIEKDFKQIIDTLTRSELAHDGLAILIDEFQELQNIPILLDILRKLSENQIGIIIICAGLPNLVNNPYFEKFNRTATNISLKSLNKKQILDLIYLPIELKTNLSRYEIESCFDSNTISEIVHKSGGNPHHIRVLCSKMFDFFKRADKITKLIINRQVMEDVMEYYSGVSENSRIIKNALEACTKEDLKIFQKLYYYEGLNLHSIILLRLSFSSIIPAQEEIIKNEIFEDLKEIFDMKLFKFSHNDKTIDELSNISINGLSHVCYFFVGDVIDKLYTSYFFEDLTDSWLTHHGNLTYEDLLAQKLQDKLGNAIICDKKIQQEILYQGRIESITSDNIYDNQEIINDYDKISSIDFEKKDDDKTIELVSNIAQKHKLNYPAMIANHFNFECYYVLIIDVSVKNRRRVIKSFYPVTEKNENYLNIQENIVDYSKLIHDPLDEYMININWVYLYTLQKRVFQNIKFVDLNVESKSLIDHVKNRNFEQAIKCAKRIDFLSMKFKFKNERYHTVGKDIDDLNNLGFCFMNFGDMIQAKDIFIRLQDKNIISKINLSYLSLKEGKWEESESLLKNILKKYNDQRTKIGFLNLAITHPNIFEANTIVEDVELINVVVWNLALIKAKYDDDSSKSYSYYKKANPKTENEKIIHSRILNWMKYYFDQKDNLIKDTKSLIEKVQNGSYLYNDLCKDLEIFDK